MKVIFLDVDGVLNSHKYVSKKSMEELGVYTYLDKSKLEMLKNIVSQTTAVLVLSSSWRLDFDDNLNPVDYQGKALVEALKAESLQLYDKTDDIRGDRYIEIKSWLEKHDDVKNFIILDDDDFDWKDLRPHWLKTSYYIGLTEEICKKAIDSLNNILNYN